MEILTKDDKYLDRIRKGEVFIYPTDTIYGIGCDATNFKAVERIRKIKLRDIKPFSVIVPSKEWILENCYAKNLDKLPGSYTLILKLKNKCVSENVSKNTLGVRIPDHWISEVVKELGFPIVTTSVNKSGEKPMTSLKDLDLEVDFVIYEGEKKGKSSEIISFF